MAKQLLLFTYLIIIPEGELSSPIKGSHNYHTNCEGEYGPWYGLLEFKNADTYIVGPGNSFVCVDGTVSGSSVGPYGAHMEEMTAKIRATTQFDFILNASRKLDLRLNYGDWTDTLDPYPVMWVTYEDNYTVQYEPKIDIEMAGRIPVAIGQPVVFSILFEFLNETFDYEVRYQMTTPSSPTEMPQLQEVHVDYFDATEPSPVDDDFVFSDVETNETDEFEMETESENYTTVIEGSTGIVIEDISEKDVMVVHETVYQSNNYEIIESAPTVAPDESAKDILDLAVDLIDDEEDQIAELEAKQEALEQSATSKLDDPMVDPFVFTFDISVASVAAVSFTVIVIFAVMTALMLFICDRLRKMRVVGVWRKDLHHLLNNDVEQLIKPEKRSFDSFIQTDRTAVFTR